MKLFYTIIALSVIAGAIGCSSESIVRSDVPLARELAVKKIDIPLPPSANSIYYFVYGGGLQDLEKYIRFDLDPAEMEQALIALIQSNNKMMGRKLEYVREPIGSVSIPQPRPEFLPMSWWDPQKIERGSYRGHVDGHALRILVDEGRSRIYIYQND